MLHNLRHACWKQSMSNMHVAKQSMSTSFGHACCIIEDMHVANKACRHHSSIIEDMHVANKAYMSTWEKGRECCLSVLLQQPSHWSALSSTITSIRLPVLFSSRNSHPSLSRRISSPSAYPRACCPTSYTTYVIYTEGYPCRLPHASPPRRTDFVGQPCLCMSHGFTGHLNSAAGPSIWSMSTT